MRQARLFAARCCGFPFLLTVHYNGGMGTQINTGRIASDQRNRKPQPKLWTPIFIITILVTFAGFTTAQGLNTGMSVYVDHIGGTATFTGVLSIVFSGAGAIARLIIGPAIDSRGRRVIMLIGSAALFAGTLLPGLFPGEATLVVGRAIQGVGFAAVTTAAATAAADALPSARMGEGIGYYGLGQALATSVGPAFALFLIGTDPAENLFFALAAVAAIAVVLSIACRYEKHLELLPPEAVYRRTAEAALAAKKTAEQVGATDAPAIEAAAEPAAGASADSARTGDPCAKKPHRFPAFDILEPGALPGAIPILFLSAAFGFAVVFIGLYGTTIGIANGGIFYTFSAATMILVRLKSKAFMDTMLPIKVFAVSVASGIVSFSLLLAAPAVPTLFYVSGLFYGVCLGVGLSINQSIAVKNTPPDRWGAGNGLFLLCNDFGIGAAGFLWGVTNDAFGFGVTIVLAMCCIAASYALAWVVYPADAKFEKARGK